MSEVSVSRRRRNPSARSALPLTCTLARPWDSIIDVAEKTRKTVSAESLLSVKACSISRIAHPNASYFSQKAMSEVSVSRRRRNPSARSALLLTCTLARPRDSIIDVAEKTRKTVSAESLLSVKACSISRIAHPNASYFSQKAMSEVSVSRRRRSPSARSALPAFVYSVVFMIPLPK
jgi:hypothetical protein